MNHSPPSEAPPLLLQPYSKLCLERLQAIRAATPPLSLPTEWERVLEVWRAQPHWRSTPYAPRECEQAGMEKIPANRNPFGARWAEADALLITTRYSSPLYHQLTANPRALVYGPPGSGKTASALTLAHDALCRLPANAALRAGAFPVYCAWHAHLNLAVITTLAAQTSLQYVLARPDAFLKHSPEAQSQLLELFWACLMPGWISQRLEQTELARDEDGQQALADLRDCLTGAVPRDPAPEARLAAMVRALPVGFTQWMILVDGGEGGSNQRDEARHWLTETAKPLLATELGVKIFLPESCAPAPLSLPDFKLTWTEAELTDLLHKRLKLVGEDDTSIWCDLGARSLVPNDLLVKAAEHQPARLIEYGNDLLCSLGNAKGKITKQNLNDLFLHRRP